MLKIGYSDTYQTDKRKYRYNYNTGQLERLGRKIAKIQYQGREAPVVETGVIECYDIDPVKFEKSPMFWVYLYDDKITREEKEKGLRLSGP